MKILAFIAVALLQAQGPSLRGVVVRQGSTEPIARARVLVTKVDGGIADSRVAETDERGRFAFRGLAAGTYRLVAQHDAFVRPEARLATVGEGQSPGDVMLPMVPTAAITGRVVDEYGDPAANVYVRASLKEATFETRTNDRGEYRLFGLPPGSYTVSAAPYLAARIEDTTLGNQSPTPMIIVPTPPSPNAPGEGQAMIFLSRVLQNGDFIPFMALRRESHATVYYPGTTDRTAAGTIDVPAGAVIGAINFTTAVAASR